MILRLRPKDIRDAHSIKMFFVESMDALDFVTRSITSEVHSLELDDNTSIYHFDIKNDYDFNVMKLSGYKFFTLYDISDFGDIYIGLYDNV